MSNDLSEFKRRQAEMAADRERAESGQPESKAGVKPVSLETTLGYAPANANKITIGDVPITIAPFTLRNLGSANLAFSCLDMNTMILVMAHATKPEPEIEDVLEIYRNLIPDDKKELVTEASLRAALAGSASSISDEVTEAIADIIVLASNRHGHGIDADDVLDNLDYPSACRSLGTILSINSGLKDRFFEQSASQAQ